MISNKTLDEIDFDSIILSDEPGGLIREMAMNALGLLDDKFGPTAIVYYEHLTGNSITNDVNAMEIVRLIAGTKEKESRRLLKVLAALYQLTEWEKENESS